MNDLITVKKLNLSGYPKDASQTNQLLPSSVVGDGCASWRLKALKRAKEQAAREGQNLDEAVEEKWGSLGQLAVSVAARTAAPARAHLRAVRDRRERTENCENVADENIDYFRDASCQHSQMREPKLHDSLSWGKRVAQNWNFLSQFNHRQKNDADGSCLESLSSKINHSSEGGSVRNQGLSANQLAAKVLQLRMKGKYEEAEKILKDSEATNVEQDSRAKTIGRDTIISYGAWGMPNRQQRREHDADLPSLSIWIDDDDFDGAPTIKRRRKRGREHENKTEKNIAQHLLTQQERCLYCFENPTRPRHLIISIGNFAYLMLPRWQPLVQGHCCILTVQHEFATRSIANNVWEEIRNFKKCIIMMFAKQDKEVIFLETVMGLAQQRCHCSVECLPLPREIAKQAPLFFKKAIDEAEEEWSQHSAKRLIDTSQKGLRGSIPKDFPYFHVEFGLNKGFVHVIDDERQFKSNFGLNVIRGMLRLPEEDMYRRRKEESVETQKQAVSSFAREWEPFDWTKQLN